MNVVKEKYSLSQKKLADIESLSRKLPKCVKKDATGKVMTGKAKKVIGESLLRSGIKVLYGKKVISRKYYRVRKPIMTSQYFNLVNAYLDGGDAGLTKCIKAIKRDAWNTLSFKQKLRYIWRHITKSSN